MYCEPAAVRNALAPGDWDEEQGPDPDQPTGTAADLDDEQITDAINEADSTIDTYLSGQYVTPVAADPTPHPIDFWSRNIAAFNATLRFRQNQDLTDTDPVMIRYRATMAALIAVRDGKAVLEIPIVTGTASSIGAQAPRNPYEGSLFGAADWDLSPVGQSHLPHFPNTPGRW